MMKRLFLCIALLGIVEILFAQKKDFSYKFYGQVRTDLFYNSRSNSETVDGLFYMYPLDKQLDASGRDLNEVSNSSFYLLYTRMGVDVTGPDLGKAKTSAKVEVDFRGSGSSYSMLRLRHVYFNLNWGKSALLVGQTWHPLYGEVTPEILNLNMGAPYQPFSRAPQVRYKFTVRNLTLTAAAVWQSQYLSVGPGSNKPGVTDVVRKIDFQKRGNVPEFYVGADYRSRTFLMGAGVHVSSIVPRLKSETENGEVYKVDERITGVSAEAHVKYVKEQWLVSAKSVLGTNLTQTSTVGGYAIIGIDEITGEQNYAPLRTSGTWINVAYGKKWRPAVFFGYLKNLGASENVLGKLGTGTGLDQLFTGTAELTYNVPHWKFGAEYSVCNAWYGDEFTPKGKAVSSHGIANHRLVMTAVFQF